MNKNVNLVEWKYPLIPTMKYQQIKMKEGWKRMTIYTDKNGFFMVVWCDPRGKDVISEIVIIDNDSLRYDPKMKFLNMMEWNGVKYKIYQNLDPVVSKAPSLLQRIFSGVFFKIR